MSTLAVFVSANRTINLSSGSFATVGSESGAGQRRPFATTPPQRDALNFPHAIPTSCNLARPTQPQPPSPPSSPLPPPAIPPIRRPACRRGVQALPAFERNRIPKLLELLVAPVDGRRIERDPDFPGFADRYGMRPADTHAIGQGGRPLQAGDAGFRVVCPDTAVQRFPGILPGRRDSALGGLPFQVGRGWRTGGRRAGIVRSPYLHGQQHLLVVNVAMEGHQPDVDSPFRQLGHHLVGARIEPETDQDHPDGPEGAVTQIASPLEAPFAVEPGLG